MSMKKLSSLALIALISAGAAACNDSDDDNKPNPNVNCDETPDHAECKEPGPGPDPNPAACDDAPEVVELNGDVTEDTTLCKDSLIVLTEKVYVTNGATLTVQAGATLYGEPGSALIVTTEGRIHAEGSASEPIVFTSSHLAPGEDASQAKAGDWGGIVLLGLAKNNVPGGTNQIEGIDPGQGGEKATYGGEDDSHDCGTMKYVRVEYAGFEMSPDNELNALTLGSCGDQTTLEYIQIIEGVDDGIEFFGGKTNLKYALVTNTGDDGVDFDEGFRGLMQFIAVEIATPLSGDPSGFEWDSLNANHDAEPRAGVQMSNATVWMTTDRADDNITGMMIRRGASASLRNVLIANVVGKRAAATVINNSVDHVTGEGNVIIGAGPAFQESNEFDFESMFNILEEAYTFATAFPPTPAASDFDGVAVDAHTGDFFSPAAYVGAFDPSKPADQQWTAGWTRNP